MSDTEEPKAEAGGESAPEEAAEEHQEEVQPEPLEDEPRKKRRRWPWVIIGLIVIFIVGYIPFYYTSNPNQCAMCHKMKPYVDSWKKSFHGENETHCNECHVRPGWFPYLTYRIGFYREIYAEAFDKELAPWGATTPGSESCTRGMCHSTNRLNSRSGDLNVNHEVHEKKAKKACNYCHAGASHAGIKGIGMQTPPRQQCFICHKDKVNKCSFCHTVKYKDGMVTDKPHI
jgi:hypothetical protein